MLDIAEITLGARPGVRDWGLLQSAVDRPRAGMFGEAAYPNLFQKAAALLHSLTSNHALIDGNKRTGWAATMVFLDINGHPLAEPLDEDAAEEFVLAVAQSRMEVPQIARTLRRFVHPQVHGVPVDPEIVEEDEEQAG